MSEPPNEEAFDESELQRLLGPGNRVLDCRLSPLLPPGENFACFISRIVARVERDDGTEEELDLVAKMFPGAQNIREVFDFPFMFGKEIFFYEKLAPALSQLCVEFGLEKEEVLDISPRIFGCRMSRSPEKRSVDEGVVILMENLKSNGYYTLDKIRGLDYEHAEAAIRSLSRFHALCVACKHHRPAFFENEVLEYAKMVPFKQDPDQPNVFDVLFDMMHRDSRIAALSERIEKLLGPLDDFAKDFFGYIAQEPWLSIAHYDCWTNNILYHNDKNGKVDSVKFIDFQNYAYNSPLRDLPYFLCTSTTDEVMRDHLGELLDLYYDTFVGALKRLKCDVKPFSRESFDEQLKIDARLEFFHNILAIKFFNAEIDKNTYDPSQLENVVIYSNINKLGYDKWYNMILTYVRQGWM